MSANAAKSEATAGNTFADMHLVLDIWPRCTGGPKLEKMEPGSREEFYLLATYVFVAAMKMEYLCKITRPFAAEASPSLAAEYKQDVDAIAERATWRERALRAESALLRLFNEVNRDHVALLEDLAKRAPKP